MSKFLKKITPFFISSLLLIIFIAPLFVFAGDVGGPGQPGTSPIVIDNPFKCPNGGADNKCTIPDFIRVIIEKIIMPIGGVVAVLMIMWAGFLYVTAGGNEAQIKKAHDALLSAVIGAAIVLGAWAISVAITNTINQLKS